MCSIILDKCCDIEWEKQAKEVKDELSEEALKGPASRGVYRPDIDGLRGLAVSFVLMIHFNFPYITGGFVGVDIFLVISGYLITSTLVSSFEHGGDLKTFYLKRFFRLFPALFTALIFTSIGAVAFLSPDQLRDYGRSLMASMTSVSNFYFWRGAGYFDASAETKPLLHTWSLGVEEQFYLMWPLLLFLCKDRSRLVFMSVLGGVAVFSLMLNNLMAIGWAPAKVDVKASLYFLLPFRIYEFVFGALLVFIDFKWLHKHWSSNLLYWSGLAHVFYAAFNFDGSIMFPAFYGLIPCQGAALLIVSGDKCISGRILSNPLMVGIGVISYSLYLVHWPVVVYAKSVMGIFYWDDRFLLIGVCGVLAIGLYYMVERPFRNPKSHVRQSRAFQPLFTLAFIGLFLMGASMAYSRFWLWRIPKINGLVIDNVGGRGKFHEQFYGGAGYPNFGAIKTSQPPDVVVMGDSHGMHYMEGVYKFLGQEEGASIYSASGVSCLHLPHFTRTTKGVDWDTLCPNSLNRGLEFVKQGNNPLVILSHYWIAQIQKAGLLDAQGKRLTTTVQMSDIIIGLIGLKELLGDSQLVVIGNVPTSIPINTYDEFTKPRLASSIPYDQLFYTPENSTHQAINTALRDAAKDTKAFIFLDPYAVLCSDGKCMNVDKDGHLIYSNQSHLSKYGSVDVVEAFLPILKSLLRHRTLKS